MKKITALMQIATPALIWPSLEQILIGAFFAIVTYGVEKLVVWLKVKIDKKLES